MITDAAVLLQTMLRREMPAAQRLDFTVEEVSQTGVRLGAAFDINRNHQGTAFAGSVNALATLAGWATVWLTLQDAGLEANAVLQDSEIRYLHPIMTEFSAFCPFPSDEERMALLDAVTLHRRGRIAVRVDVAAHDETVARFHGRYVALLPVTGTAS